MNLDDIPTGSLCVVDTNVLIYAEQSVSAQAQRLVRRCASGELKATLPQTVWQELAHKLMLAEAMMRGPVSGTNLGRRLAAKPDVVRSLSLYRAKVASLVELGFGFEPCELRDLTERAFELQERYGLLTSDAIVLAVALRLKADVLVSSDQAFRGVSELDVYYPTDLRT